MDFDLSFEISDSDPDSEVQVVGVGSQDDDSDLEVVAVTSAKANKTQEVLIEDRDDGNVVKSSSFEGPPAKNEQQTVSSAGLLSQLPGFRRFERKVHELFDSIGRKLPASRVDQTPKPRISDTKSYHTDSVSPCGEKFPNLPLKSPRMPASAVPKPPEQRQTTIPCAKWTAQPPVHNHAGNEQHPKGPLERPRNSIYVLTHQEPNVHQKTGSGQASLLPLKSPRKQKERMAVSQPSQPTMTYWMSQVPVFHHTGNQLLPVFQQKSPASPNERGPALAFQGPSPLPQPARSDHNWMSQTPVHPYAPPTCQQRPYPPAVVINPTSTGSYFTPPSTVQKPACESRFSGPIYQRPVQCRIATDLNKSQVTASPTGSLTLTTDSNGSAALHRSDVPAKKRRLALNIDSKGSAVVGPISHESVMPTKRKLSNNVASAKQEPCEVRPDTIERGLSLIDQPTTNNVPSTPTPITTKRQPAKHNTSNLALSKEPTKQTSHLPLTPKPNPGSFDQDEFISTPNQAPSEQEPITPASTQLVVKSRNPKPKTTRKTTYPINYDYDSDAISDCESGVEGTILSLWKTGSEQSDRAAQPLKEASQSESDKDGSLVHI